MDQRDSDDKEERIRRRAYEIWEESGRAEGRESEHWEQARQDVEFADELVPAEPPLAMPTNPADETEDDTIKGAQQSRSSEIPS
jgi:hypothetical protein